MSMPKPAKYILNTDYATLKNDSATITITVSIPATSIAAGATQNYASTGTVGTAGSPMEYTVSSSGSGNIWKAMSGYKSMYVENEGGATQYQFLVFVYKSGASTVSVNVYVFNGNAIDVTKTARTITVSLRSFLPPFA